MFFELTKSKLTSNNVLESSHADDEPTDRLVPPGDKVKIYLDFMVFGVAFCFMKMQNKSPTGIRSCCVWMS